MRPECGLILDPSRLSTVSFAFMWLLAVCAGTSVRDAASAFEVVFDRAVTEANGPLSLGGQALTAAVGACITGIFTIVWGGPDGQRYFITDRKGATTEVLLDADVARPVGGPLALDRHHVTIRGQVENTGKLRVTGVELAEGGCS
jgi:hypothetical protein